MKSLLCLFHKKKLWSISREREAKLLNEAQVKWSNKSWCCLKKIFSKYRALDCVRLGDKFIHEIQVIAQILNLLLFFCHSRTKRRQKFVIPICVFVSELQIPLWFDIVNGLFCIWSPRAPKLSFVTLTRIRCNVRSLLPLFFFFLDRSFVFGWNKSWS